MNRRSFLKLAACGSASLLMAGCRQLSEALPSSSPPPTGALHPTTINPPFPNSTPPASATPTLTLGPSPTPPGARTQVILVKSDERLQGVRKALEMLGADDFQGKKLLIKPNYNSADPAPGSTENDVLIPVVQWLQTRRADLLTIGDRSGMGDTRNIMRKKGLPGLADEFGFDYLIFDDLRPEDWVKVDFEGSHWPGGYPIARPVLEADGVVSLCCLKTHRFGGHFTLSLKNSVGMVAKTVAGDEVNYMNYLHNSADQRVLIAEINRAYSPDLIMMDGIEAFVSGGPDSGKTVHPGVILAGIDRVAMDAVGVAILRHFGTTPEVQQGPIFELAQIARAVELGVGVDSAEKIELVADDPESKSFAAQIRRILDEQG